jgi:hypothetical protein
MGCGDFPVFAITELDRRHGGCHFQDLASAPFQRSCVAYNVSGFDYHWFLPLLFEVAVCVSTLALKQSIISRALFFLSI